MAAQIIAMSSPIPEGTLAKVTLEDGGSDAQFGPLLGDRISGGYKRKEAGSEELLDLYLSRIKRLNSRLNTVISLDIPAARKRARQADEALRRGDIWGPLHGVPMTFTDSFDVIGMPSTWGVAELRGTIRASMRLKSKNSWKRAPSCSARPMSGLISSAGPRRMTYTASQATRGICRARLVAFWRSRGCSCRGGSRLSKLASIWRWRRNVAHFCGLWGHKPSYGITNLLGNVMPGVGAKPDLAVIGPMARSAVELQDRARNVLH